MQVGKEAYNLGSEGGKGVDEIEGGGAGSEVGVREVECGIEGGV